MAGQLPGTKTENGGQTAEGRLSANEFNQFVEFVEDLSESKQDELTAGNGINIAQDVVSVDYDTNTMDVNNGKIKVKDGVYLPAITLQGFHATYQEAVACIGDYSVGDKIIVGNGNMYVKVFGIHGYSWISVGSAKYGNFYNCGADGLYVKCNSNTIAKINRVFGSASTYNVGATNGAIPVNRGTLTNGEVVIIGNNGLKSTPTLGSNILRFGGEVLQDNLSPLDMGLDGVVGANRFAAFDAEQIVVERSSDGGNNWSTVSGLDIEKLRLFRESKGGSIPVIDSGTMTISNQIRLTVDTSKNAAGAELGDVYFKWQHLLMNVSTNGAKWGNEHKLRLLIEGMKRSTEGGTLEWETIKDTFVRGWSGWNSIPISESGLLVGGFQSQSQEANIYWYLRFTFSCNEITNNPQLPTITSIFAIRAIKGYGDNEWTEKNYLATYGQPFYVDRNIDTRFEGSVVPKLADGESYLGREYYRWKALYAKNINVYNVYPAANETYGMGSANNTWLDVYAKYLHGILKMQSAGSVLTTQKGDGTFTAEYQLLKNTNGIFPTTNNTNMLITMNRHDGNYYSQLGLSSDGNIYYRSFNGTAIDDRTPWKKIAFEEGKLDKIYFYLSDSSGNITLKKLVDNTATTDQISSLHMFLKDNKYTLFMDSGQGSYTHVSYYGGTAVYLYFVYDNKPYSCVLNPDDTCTCTDLLAQKQDTLVSGTNIKTINDTSVLGAGNIKIPYVPDINGDYLPTQWGHPVTKTDTEMDEMGFNTFVLADILSGLISRCKIAYTSEYGNYYDISTISGATYKANGDYQIYLSCHNKVDDSSASFYNIEYDHSTAEFTISFGEA